VSRRRTKRGWRELPSRRDPLGLEICPLTAAIGAEVSGVDLRKPLERPELDALRRALDLHLALFFRDQPLSPAELVAFGRQLGPLAIHPFAPRHPDHPEVVVLDQVHPAGEGADAWHADATFMPEPPRYGVLQAVQLPALGGDTCFASAIAACEALSPALLALLEKLRGVHDLTRQLRGAQSRNRTAPGAMDLGAMQARWPPHAHPVVIAHPASGRRGLFVNSNYTVALEGLAPAESDALLRLLFDHVRSPDFQCRFRWEPGSIAVWDNHFVQHYAVPDYRERRVMHRLNVAGGPPAARDREEGR
jgi:taurine dioxygenase